MSNSFVSIGDVVGPGLGEDGGTSELLGDTRTCASAIQAGQPVRITDDNKWEVCDTYSYETASAIALAVESGGVGDKVLAIYLGKIDNSDFHFGNQEALFVKSDGTVTNVATTIVGEFITRIGKGLYDGSIIVQFEEPVEVT